MLVVCIRMLVVCIRMLVVCIRMLVVCIHMLVVCIRMLVECMRMYLYVPYVTRMSLVCYPYVLVWCFSPDPENWVEIGAFPNATLTSDSYERPPPPSPQLQIDFLGNQSKY